MALDWIAREEESGSAGVGLSSRSRRGVIASELSRAEAELTTSRLAGQELRFAKEKRDILQLAMSQITPDSLA